MYVHSPSPSAPLKSLDPYVTFFFFFFFDEQTHMFHRRDKPAVSNWIEMKEPSLPSWLHVTQLLGFLFIYLLLFLVLIKSVNHNTTSVYHRVLLVW